MSETRPQTLSTVAQAGLLAGSISTFASTTTDAPPTHNSENSAPTTAVDGGTISSNNSLTTGASSSMTTDMQDDSNTDVVWVPYLGLVFLVLACAVLGVSYRNRYIRLRKRRSVYLDYVHRNIDLNRKRLYGIMRSPALNVLPVDYYTTVSSHDNVHVCTCAKMKRGHSKWCLAHKRVEHRSPNRYVGHHYGHTNDAYVANDLDIVPFKPSKYKANQHAFLVRENNNSGCENCRLDTDQTVKNPEEPQEQKVCNISVDETRECLETDLIPNSKRHQKRPAFLPIDIHPEREDIQDISKAFSTSSVKRRMTFPEIERHNIHKTRPPSDEGQGDSGPDSSLPYSDIEGHAHFADTEGHSLTHHTTHTHHTLTQTPPPQTHTRNTQKYSASLHRSLSEASHDAKQHSDGTDVDSASSSLPAEILRGVSVKNQLSYTTNETETGHGSKQRKGLHNQPDSHGFYNINETEEIERQGRYQNTSKKNETKTYQRTNKTKEFTQTQRHVNEDNVDKDAAKNKHPISLADRDNLYTGKDRRSKTRNTSFHEHFINKDSIIIDSNNESSSDASIPNKKYSANRGRLTKMDSGFVNSAFSSDESENPSDNSAETSYPNKGRNRPVPVLLHAPSVPQNLAWQRDTTLSPSSRSSQLIDSKSVVSRTKQALDESDRSTRNFLPPGHSQHRVKLRNERKDLNYKVQINQSESSDHSSNASSDWNVDKYSQIYTISKGTGAFRSTNGTDTRGASGALV